MPVALNEFHDRRMIAVRVADMASTGERGNNNQRDTRTIAEEINGLHEAGIKVSSAFVKGHDESGFFSQLRVCLKAIHYTLNERLKHIELGACRMSVTKAVSLKIGH